jgi:hypothetical protein
MKNKQDFFPHHKIVFLLCALCIWGYIILRSIYVPLVHDEASTFYHYIHVAEFIPGEAHWDANNHILNTAISILFYHWLGAEEWVLRLGNILFFPLYAFFIFLISKKLSGNFVKLGFILVMLTIHGVIEFFGYTRGYGMSMSLMLGAIYFMIEFIQQNKSRLLVFCLLLMSLAVFANLTLSNALLAIIIWLVWIIFLGNENIKKIKQILIVLGLGCIPFLIAAYISFELKNRGLLYYGFASGFFPNTTQSLIKMMFGSHHVFIDFFAGILALFLLLILFVSLIKYRLNFFKQQAVVFLGLLTANLCAIFIQHWVLNIRFPEDRTGMHLVVLFIVAVFFGVNTFSNQRGVLFFLLPLLAFPVHFINHANLAYSTHWKNEHMDESSFLRILKDNPNPEFAASVGGYGIQHQVWNYYNFKHGGNNPMLSFSDYPSFHYDYLVLNPLEQQMPSVNLYTLLEKDPYSGIAYYKRKINTTWTEDTTIINNTAVDFDKKEYLVFYEEKTNRLRKKALGVDVKLLFNSPTSPMKGVVVVSVDNLSDMKNLYYQSVSTHGLKTAYNKSYGEEFHQFFSVPELQEDSVRLTIYFWNFKQMPGEYRNLQIKILTR